MNAGTPSLAKPSTVEKVISSVRKSTKLDSNAEITLEANPTSSESCRLSSFKAAGVTRLSLGIQVEVDEVLMQCVYVVISL